MTTSVPPVDQPTPERRRRWLRLCLGLMLALAIALLGLHTGPAKNAIAALLASWATSTLGVSVSLTQLDYQLWSGEATIGGLRALGPGLDATSQRIEVRFVPGTGVEVRAFEPRLQIAAAATDSSQPNEPNARPWTSLLQLAKIEVVNGAVQLLGADGRPQMDLNGIDALMTRTSNGTGGTLRVSAAEAGHAGGARLERITIEARFEMPPDTGALVVPSASVSAAGLELGVAGELRHTNPLAVQARFDGVVESTLVAVALPNQRVDSLGSHPITVRGRLENDRLIADALEVEMFGGVITARGTAGLSDRAGELAVTARDLDLHEVSSTIASSVAIASRVDAEFAVRMSDWNPESLNGSGTVAFRSQSSRGVPIAGVVKVGLNGRTLTYAAERLTARDVAVTLDGQISAAGEMSAQYAAHVPAVDRLPTVLADLGMRVSTLPLTGAITAAGTLEGRLPELGLSARVTSDDVSAYGVHFGLDADVRMTRASVQIVSLVARGADAAARAGGEIPLQPGGQWNVTGDLQRLDLSELLAGRGIAARANASGSFAIDGTRADPVMRVTLDSDAVTTGTDASEAASLQTLAQVSRAGVVIERAAGTVAGGTLAVSGSWDPATGAIHGRVEATQIDVPRLHWFAPQLREVASTLALTAEIAGSLSAPSGSAHVSLADTRLRGVDLPDVTLDVSSDGREMSLAGWLDERSFLSGRGGVASPWPLELKVEIAALPIADVVRVIPLPVGAVAEVSLAGHANVRVHLGDLSAFEYESEISSAEIRVTRDWRAGPFSVSGDRERFSIRGLDLRSGDSRVNVDGGLGFTEQSGTLTLSGTALLADLAWLRPGIQADGQGEVDMRIAGTTASPIFAGRVTLRDGSLKAETVQLDEIQIEAIAEESTLRIEKATARVAGGEARVTGALPFGPQAGGRPRQLEFTLRGVDLATFATSAAQSAKLSAPVDLDGRVTLSQLALEAIEARGALTRMAVSADTERLDLEAPVSWTFEGGTLAHTPLRLRGPKGNATLSATFASIGGEVRFGADGSGTMDLSIANSLLAGTGVVGGTLTFDARLARTEARWTTGGTASVVDGRFVLRSPELALTDLRATLRADGERIELVEATAAMGDGKIVAHGQAVITGDDVDVDLRLRADRVPLVYPEGLQTRSSGEIRLSGTSERARITGDLVVHRAIYERELDRTAEALDRAGVRVAEIASRGSFADLTELELTLRLDDGVRIATSTATLVIDGTVRAGGTLATPEVDGSLSVREGGTIRVSRALVRLQGGRIELRGYPTRPPEIQIQGATQVTGVRIDMALSGSLDDVRMNLSSSNRSDLSQGDLATLILTGRTTTDAAAESGAIVGEEVAAALGQALDRRLGGPLMIDVSRDESLIVEDTDPSQRLNIGVPLNERLYVIYSRSLDSEALRWIVDFRPGGDFRVRGIANDDGSEALEVSHRFGFHVWSRKYRTARPKDARLAIGEVAIIGAPPGTEAELRNRLKLKGGAEFDYFRGEEAAARAREWLVTRGYLTAAVEVRETPRDTEVDLTVRIDPGPHVTVEWRGDDPGGAEKKHVNAGWGTFLPLQDTAERLARDVGHRLRARDYYSAVVTAEVRSDNGAAHAIFDVRRGEKGSGVDLVFEGNASIPDATLAAVIPDRDNAAFFALLEADGAQRMPTAIRVAYFREGFLQAEVGAPAAQVDPPSRRLVVTFPIREGPRATVIAFDVPPEVTTLEGAVAPAFELRMGDRFRFDAYNADRARLRTWYRNEGFPEARVQGVVEPTPDGVVVRLRAEPGPRVRVADVRTSREGHTRAGVIRRAVGMTEGDLARASDLDEARERLTETGVFRSVDVRLASSPGQENVRDVVVDLSERSDINMEYSLRYTTAGSGQVGGTPADSDAGLQVGAATEFVNPFGWAARYRLYGLYGAERRLLGGRYESATFFGRRWETQVFLFDDEDLVEDIESLAERVRGITFQQTKRWRNTLDGRRLQDGLRLQWGYTYKRIRYTSLETSETLGGLRAGPILSLIGDSRDSVTDPHRGVFWSVGTETALEALGSDVDYFKVFSQVFFYTPLTPRITWAQGYRVGVVPGDDPLLLLESRFTAGGASSVRGFDEKSLSPTGPEGEEIGGQAVAIINQELRFPLWKRLFGGVFYDAGNAFLLAGDMSLGALRQSAGAGLRLMFPFGPVRLDWSSVIDPREGEKRSRLHFSIGHVF